MSMWIICTSEHGFWGGSFQPVACDGLCLPFPLSEDAPASDYTKIGYTKTDVLIQQGQNKLEQDTGSRILDWTIACQVLETWVWTWDWGSLRFWFSTGFRMTATSAAPEAYLDNASKTAEYLHKVCAGLGKAVASSSGKSTAKQGMFLSLEKWINFYKSLPSLVMTVSVGARSIKDWCPVR